MQSNISLILLFFSTFFLYLYFWGCFFSQCSDWLFYFWLCCYYLALIQGIRSIWLDLVPFSLFFLYPQVHGLSKSSNDFPVREGYIYAHNLLWYFEGIVFHLIKVFLWGINCVANLIKFFRTLNFWNIIINLNLSYFLR